MMRLNAATGHLQGVGAGHPAPLLLRGQHAIRPLRSPTTLPVGFGGQEPRISELALEPGDRVLCFADGLIEEHETGGAEFGEEQLIDWVDRIARTGTEVRTAVRSLSHTLMRERDGITTNDATLLLIEWRGATKAGRPAV